MKKVYGCEELSSCPKGYMSDCTGCGDGHNVTVVVYGLCKGRHPLPVEDFIYENEITDPTDVLGLTMSAMKFFKADPDFEKSAFVEIYVTGLTVALIAAINAAHMLNKSVTLYHYDVTSGEYYAQRVRTQSIID